MFITRTNVSSTWSEQVISSSWWDTTKARHLRRILKPAPKLLLPLGKGYQSPTKAGVVIRELISGPLREEMYANISDAFLEFVKSKELARKTAARRQKKVPITTGRCVTEAEAKAILAGRSKLSSNPFPAPSTSSLNPSKVPIYIRRPFSIRTRVATEARTPEEEPRSRGGGSAAKESSKKNFVTK